MKVLKNHIREIREQLNISQRDLAAALGVTDRALRLYEAGERELHIDTALLIAETLGRPVGQVFYIADE